VKMEVYSRDEARHTEKSDLNTLIHDVWCFYLFSFTAARVSTHLLTYLLTYLLTSGL